jgi:hypothetical protein
MYGEQTSEMVGNAEAISRDYDSGLIVKGLIKKCNRVAPLCRRPEPYTSSPCTPIKSLRKNEWAPAIKCCNVDLARPAVHPTKSSG